MCVCCCVLLDAPSSLKGRGGGEGRGGSVDLNFSLSRVSLGTQRSLPRVTFEPAIHHRVNGLISISFITVHENGVLSFSCDMHNVAAA